MALWGRDILACLWDTQKGPWSAQPGPGEPASWRKHNLNISFSANEVLQLFLQGGGTRTVPAEPLIPPSELLSTFHCRTSYKRQTFSQDEAALLVGEGKAPRHAGKEIQSRGFRSQTSPKVLVPLVLGLVSKCRRPGLTSGGAAPRAGISDHLLSGKERPQAGAARVGALNPLWAVRQGTG